MLAWGRPSVRGELVEPWGRWKNCPSTGSGRTGFEKVLPRIGPFLERTMLLRYTGVALLALEPKSRRLNLTNGRYMGRFGCMFSQELRAQITGKAKRWPQTYAQLNGGKQWTWD